MRLAVPSGLIIGVATFVAYLLVYAGPEQTEEQRMQAGTSALITLITIALWVLAVVGLYGERRRLFAADFLTDG